MPKYEAELVRSARAVARYQRVIREFRRRIKEAQRELRAEQRNLRALARTAPAPDVMPMRIFGADVGLKATGTDGEPHGH